MLGAPMTTEIKVTPLRLPEATRTCPASTVSPVFTPVIHGTLPTRSLRLTTVRWTAPLWRVIRGVSTIFLKSRTRRRRSVRVAGPEPEQRLAGARLVSRRHEASAGVEPESEVGGHQLRRARHRPRDRRVSGGESRAVAGVDQDPGAGGDGWRGGNGALVRSRQTGKERPHTRPRPQGGAPG